MKIFILLATLTLGLNAFGISINCSSADGKLHYNYGTFDGGANRRASSSLVYDGKTLMSENSSLSAQDFAAASVTFEEGLVWSSAPVTASNYEVSQFVQKALVASLAPEKPVTIFEGLVLCEKSRYVGPPRP